MGAEHKGVTGRVYVSIHANNFDDIDAVVTPCKYGKEHFRQCRIYTHPTQSRAYIGGIQLYYTMSDRFLASGVPSPLCPVQLVVLKYRAKRGGERSGGINTTTDM